VIRTDDGRLVEETVDYRGVVQDERGSHIGYYLYRPDACTDEIPLHSVEEIKLVRRVEERIRRGEVDPFDVPDHREGAWKVIYEETEEG